MDHSKDEEVKQLFETVKNEQKGQLDILVNNAYAGVNMMGSYLARDKMGVSKVIFPKINMRRGFNSI